TPPTALSCRKAHSRHALIVACESERLAEPNAAFLANGQRRHPANTAETCRHDLFGGRSRWRAFPDDGARRGAVARRQDCIGGVPARSVTRAAALHARLKARATSAGPRHVHTGYNHPL